MTRRKLIAVLCGARARWACLALLAAVCAPLARAQDPPPQSVPSPGAADQDPETIFPHSEDARWWVAGQANIIFQYHPGFHSLYSGPNSLSAAKQSATTHIFTLFTGYQLTRNTEILADLEEASGGGIGTSTGLAGFTDLDAVRTVQGAPLATTPYFARLMLHQIIPLRRERVPAGRGPLGLATSLPVRRIEFRIGKFDLTDFFDLNGVGGDDHLQFMNWTTLNNGAWDYAANTRGYTDGALLEYDDRAWSLRFAEALMPKVANGINLDANIARARAENIELELRPGLFAGRPSVVRLLTYVNHGNLGDYRQAVALFLAGKTPQPIIEDTRQQGRIKYGFGVNLEQQVTRDLRVYGRFGWNEGRHESFAYTEVDQTFAFGADYRGYRWHRAHDKLGATFVTNAISQDHQLYLKLGGLGFLLGDGTLDYGRENIFEGYYNAHFWRGLYGSFDLQHIQNPGYNRDRGPVWVPGLRLHVEF